MSAAIPSWVREVQPTEVRVSLVPYSTDRELFTTEEETGRFFSDSWRMWEAVSTDYDTPTPPHLFIMDFDGISTLDSHNATNGLIHVLANFRKRERPIYTAFDNLKDLGENNPWQSLNRTFEHLRTKRVAVARRENLPNYQLIGAHQFTKGRHWQDIFYRLEATRQWVEGPDFSRGGNLPISPRTCVNYLHQMAKEGVVFKKNAGGFSYYRSLL